MGRHISFRLALNKKGKDSNKPKRSTSAYFYFLAHCREEANKAGRSISKVAEFTKECSEKWKCMTDSNKRPFEEKAATDKARYTREMASYSGKSKKDEGKPKRPQSAYFLFLADFRVKMKGKNIDHKEILKLAGEEWRKLTVEKKQPYEKVRRNRRSMKQHYQIGRRAVVAPNRMQMAQMMTRMKWKKMMKRMTKKRKMMMMMMMSNPPPLQVYMFTVSSKHIIIH